MELWTEQHIKSLLPALAVMILMGLLLRRIIGSKSIKIRIIPIQIIAILLVLLEIGKQFTSFQRGYDLYHIPLHFCSLFIFMLPAMAFYRGKRMQMVFAITSALCTAVFCLMLIYPNLIYSAGNIEHFFEDFLDFHTVAFHNLVMLAFVLILTLELHIPIPKGETKAVALFMLTFCTIAAGMAQILRTNFANFYSCNIPVLEALKKSIEPVLGAALTQLLYVLIVALLHILFVLGCHFMYRTLAKGMQSKHRKERQPTL